METQPADGMGASRGQADVTRFLSAWQSTVSGGDAQTIETHISRVYLTGDSVLKLKKPVRYAYLDFSTPALRLRACEHEYELNQRTAPSLYIGVRRIMRDNAGVLNFDGEGEFVDAVVEMRRFDQSTLFDALVSRGELTRDLISDFARRIAGFHARADVSKIFGGADAMRSVLDINDRSLRATGLVSNMEADEIAHAFVSSLASCAALLDQRRASGFVRRCHGDLTLRNICLVNGVPTPFDCIEFNDELATIDVFYDIAFPIMDLLHRGSADLANFLFNRYLDETGDIEGVALTPFFVATRAAVRAHVAATRATNLTGAERDAAIQETSSYLDLARSALRPAQARLIAIGGRSGSGKSTLAAALAPTLSPPPGARVISSDRIRKRLLGVRPDERLGGEAYLPEVSTHVYSIMRDEAFETLRRGCPAIVDAVFDRPAARLAVESLALIAGVGFTGFWLEAPTETMAQRIEGRIGDPSDATVEVLHRQLAHDPGDIAWRPIDSARGISAILAEVAAMR